MSSHREAPAISKDPTADSTDVYAFVSYDKTDHVTLIANYIPLQAPDGGPTFYEFSDDVQYNVNIDNDGDGKAEIVFQFRFSTVNKFPQVFLYNTGPIRSLTSPTGGSVSTGDTWNRQQTYTLNRVDISGDGKRKTTTLGTNLPVPPCNVGPLSTPGYASLASQAITGFSAGGYTGTTFAGQRAEGFYVDLGALFDLGGLRGFENYHVGGPAAKLLAGMPGVNSTAAVNVHSLALQIPISQLTAGTPNSTIDPRAVIGVWTSAARQKVRITDGNPATGETTQSGPYTQVSRLGSPLVNELLIGIGFKDRWNASPPTSDGGTDLLPFFENPVLAQLIPSLYTEDGAPEGKSLFPNLKAYNRAPTATPPRPDIVAVFLTGIPKGVVSPTFSTFNGTGVKAEMLRLNTAIAPTPLARANSLGVLGSDLAGFPNGRRVFDDVATIELRAVAGAILGRVVPGGYQADGAAGLVDFSITSPPDGTDRTAKGTEAYLPTFPYLGTPYSGYSTPDKTPVGNITVPGTND